jgi:lysophospholipase L1-like esterase
VRAGAAVVVAALLALAATAGAAQASVYVALGDSLARGWQPDASGHSHSTDAGYVDGVARSLAASHHALSTVKLGCPGETAESMLGGGKCSYAHGTQLREAEAVLRAHRGHVAAVTVNIGDNDVERCIHRSGVDEDCAEHELAVVRDRLPRIARRLRAAAGPDVPIAGLTDYDQFLAYWLRGAKGRRIARRSVQIVLGLNRTADAAYADAGLLVADAADDFETAVLDERVKLRGHGRVPVAVARVCRWTWACSDAPIGFNDHANATGYRVLARVVTTALQAR